MSGFDCPIDKATIKAALEQGIRELRTQICKLLRDLKVTGTGKGWAWMESQVGLVCSARLLSDHVTSAQHELCLSPLLLLLCSSLL